MNNMVKKIVYMVISVAVSIYVGAILDQIFDVSTSAVIMGAFILMKPSSWD